MTPRLFLGLSLDDHVERALERANPLVKKLFLGGGDYLEQIVHRDQLWLGKFLETPLPCPSFELLEANIYSIARRVVPEVDLQGYPLELFATTDDQSETR